MVRAHPGAQSFPGLRQFVLIFKSLLKLVLLENHGEILGMDLKNSSVYKLDYQLEIDHFLATKKMTGGPLTESLFVMTLFRERKNCLKNAFLII